MGGYSRKPIVKILSIGEVKPMKEILDILVNNGASIALLAYFIYKDNRFTERILTTLTAIEKTVSERGKAK